MWDEETFPRTTGAETRAVVATTKKTQSGTVDVNEATFEELQTLPGIGPKIAERIIAGRPYRKIDDLLKVSGIGEVKLRELKPYARVNQEEKSGAEQ